jgi:hypothetical protein
MLTHQDFDRNDIQIAIKNLNIFPNVLIKIIVKYITNVNYDMGGCMELLIEPSMVLQIYEQFKHKLVYTNIETLYCKSTYVCFQFKKHKWSKWICNSTHPENCSNILKSQLKKKMIETYKGMLSFYDIKNTSNKIKAFGIIKKTFWNYANKSIPTILKKVKELLYDKTFINKLDKKLDMILFKNGVLDLKTKKIRNGQPNDYLSLSTLIDYVPLKKCDKSIVDEINTYMGQVFTNIKVKKKIWKILTNSLQGINPNNDLYMWAGTGSNSKSVLTNLFMNSFGEYCIKLPTSISLILNVYDNYPQFRYMASLRGKRFACFHELDEGDEINKHKLNAFLYNTSVNSKLKLNAIIHTNGVIYDKDDKYECDEICIIKFTSSFVNNPNKENKSHFKRDITIHTKIKNWHETFASMLVDKCI